MMIRKYNKNVTYKAATSESLHLAAALGEQLFGLLLQFVRSPPRLQHRLPFILHQVLHLLEFIFHLRVKLLHTNKPALRG